MRVKSKKVIYLLGVVLLTLLTFSSVFAQDAGGSKDHPLISRFPGSSITRYDMKQFNEYAVPLGKMAKGALTKSQKLEGTVTQITYAAPKDRSILEILRNYESAMKNAGFVTLFSGKKMNWGINGWINLPGLQSGPLAMVRQRWAHS